MFYLTIVIKDLTSLSFLVGKRVDILCVHGNSACFKVVCCFCFSKRSFRNITRMSNNLDSDNGQAFCYVGHDLD